MRLNTPFPTPSPKISLWPTGYQAIGCRVASTLCSRAMTPPVRTRPDARLTSLLRARAISHLPRGIPSRRILRSIQQLEAACAHSRPETTPGTGRVSWQARPRSVCSSHLFRQGAAWHLRPAQRALVHTLAPRPRIDARGGFRQPGLWFALTGPHQLLESFGSLKRDWYNPRVSRSEVSPSRQCLPR